MVKMEKLLTDVNVMGTDQPLTIGISHAFEYFTDINDLENTIAKADAMMYLNKQQRKAHRSDPALPSQPLMDNQSFLNR